MHVPVSQNTVVQRRRAFVYCIRNITSLAPEGPTTLSHYE